ncbi:MAG: hypothetical protein LUG46_08200 [Erysipelotrichaceae bacterium]|nr:hypothetical protein [Erysipelotrichaceae bacterium]
MKILVCAKDKKYQDRIIELIQSIECEERLEIESSTTLLSNRRKYDIAFLDLRIDAKKAFAMGIKLYEMNHCVNFYMYDDLSYIHDFFNAWGFQYLLNDQDDLIKDELQRAYKRYLDVHCKVILRDEHQVMIFNPCNVQYIEDYNHHMKVAVGNEKYIGVIDDYEVIKKQLIELHYLQSHPHYLVNVAYIMEYKSHEIRMKNLDFLPTTLRNIDIQRAILALK